MGSSLACLSEQRSVRAWCLLTHKGQSRQSVPGWDLTGLTTRRVQRDGLQVSMVILLQEGTTGECKHASKQQERERERVREGASRKRLPSFSTKGQEGLAGRA